MAETVYKIPLSNVPQRFNITLAGRDFIFICRWFFAMELWCFSLLDADTEAVLINDMPLVTGCNLLGQFKHLGIPGALVCVGTGSNQAPPTLENLGTDVNLFYVVDLEALA